MTRSTHRYAGYHVGCVGGPLDGQGHIVPHYPKGVLQKLSVLLDDVRTAKPDDPVRIGYYLLWEDQEDPTVCYWRWMGLERPQ